jgi:hypothetical protein
MIQDFDRVTDKTGTSAVFEVTMWKGKNIPLETETGAKLQVYHTHRYVMLVVRGSVFYYIRQRV